MYKMIGTAFSALILGISTFLVIFYILYYSGLKNLKKDGKFSYKESLYYSISISVAFTTIITIISILADKSARKNK